MVDSESDAVFTPYKGMLFATGSSTLLADRLQLAFYLSDDGQIVPLERQQQSWSQMYAQLVRHGDRT